MQGPEPREFTYKTTLRCDAFKSDNPIAFSLKMCSKCERGKQFAERPRDRAPNVDTPYEDQKKTGPKRERGAHSDIATATPIEDSRPQVSKARAKLEFFFAAETPIEDSWAQTPKTRAFCGF